MITPGAIVKEIVSKLGGKNIKIDFNPNEELILESIKIGKYTIEFVVEYESVETSSMSATREMPKEAEYKFTIKNIDELYVYENGNSIDIPERYLQYLAINIEDFIQ